MSFLRAQIRSLLLEYAMSDEVVIDVALEDIEEAFASGKSDGDIRGVIMQDVPLYRIIDDLGLSKVRGTGKITPGDWATVEESAKGAQFGFDLEDVVQFGLSQNKQRWFRHDDPKTGELGPKTNYPGRLRGNLWVIEVNAAFTPFYTMSYSGSDKIIGPINPFALPGDKKFDQATHDLIQAYLVDKNRENADILRKHISRLNLRLSKKGCDTGLGCSIDVGSSDIVKTYRVDKGDSGGYDLIPMAITDALASIEGKDIKHKQTPFDVVESIAREYVRQLFKEDAMGFVHQLAGPEAEDFFGGKIDKARGREIKQAFAKHADHQWLSTLDTVHWAMDVYSLSDLIGKGKDELSTTMALPSDPLRFISYAPYGLWIKGRITLASDTQDKIYSGRHRDYDAPIEGTEEEVAHRDKSSGRNKRPTMSKMYKRYANLQPGEEYSEKMARNIPYVLDQSTWNPVSPSVTNEALVDNWRPIGIVVAKSDVEEAVLKSAAKLSSKGGSVYGSPAKDINYFAAGAVKEVMLAALELDVPIYNTSRAKLWEPTKSAIQEIREYTRELLLSEDSFGYIKDMVGAQESGEIDRDHSVTDWDDYEEKTNVRSKKAAVSQSKQKGLFRKHADHQWLSSLNTVHWGRRSGQANDLAHMSGRDELSTIMSLPNKPLGKAMGSLGLWIKGHISWATNHQDSTYSGVADDYNWTQQQTKSSGRNKRPMNIQWRFAQDWADAIESGEMSDRAKKSLPVLGAENWNPSRYDSNEALVDNWSVYAVVVNTPNAGDYLNKLKTDSSLRKRFSLIEDLAHSYGVPVVSIGKSLILPANMTLNTYLEKLPGD